MTTETEYRALLERALRCLNDRRLVENECDRRKRNETNQDHADRISSVMQRNEDLRELIEEVEAALAAPAAAPVMNINSSQIAQLAQFACAGDALDEPTDICVQRKPAGKDTDGEDAPAGLYAWIAEYAEEGMLFLDPDGAATVPAWHDAPEVAALKAERDRLLAVLRIVRGKHGCGALTLPKADLERIDATIAKAEGGAA